MKTYANIHSVEHFCNRSKITLNIGGPHVEYVTLKNKITAIERKHNAQSMLFENKSSLNFDNKGNVNGLSNGDCGGSIVFHNHSCNPKEAMKELMELLESL